MVGNGWYQRGIEGTWMIVETSTSLDMLQKRRIAKGFPGQWHNFLKPSNIWSLSILLYLEENILGSWGKENLHECFSRLDRFLFSSEWDEEFIKIKIACCLELCACLFELWGMGFYKRLFQIWKLVDGGGRI